MVLRWTHGLGENVQREMVGIVQRFLKSEEAKEILQAPAFYTEIPFVLRLPYGLIQGALDLIVEGAVDPGDSVLSIESSRELPGSRPGRGPTIRLGDKACLFDPNLTALLDEAAAGLKSLRVQRLRLTGGTCEATAYQTFGFESAGVAIPLVNYHNGWGAKTIGPEKVRMEDVDGAVRLLVEAARLFPSRSALRGRLRQRLAARHKSLVRFL